MNKKQKQALEANFKALMAQVNATLDPNGYLSAPTYLIPRGGHTLQATLFTEYSGPWIACRWRTGDPALLQAYLNAKGGAALAAENEASHAAYDAYEASCKAETAAIKASGLPYDNPFSLKWNHHGADCLDSLKQGLGPLLNAPQFDHTEDSRGDVTLTRLHDGSTRFLQGDSARQFIDEVPPSENGPLYDCYVSEYFNCIEEN